MTTRISLLSAALAIASLAALPALAQSMTAPAPSASIESGTHADTTKTGVQGNVKPQANDAHKAKDKTAVSKKLPEQVAQHPSAAAKPDGTVKSDTAQPDTSK